MSKNGSKTVTVDLLLPSGAASRPALVGNPSLSVKLVRGRVTAVHSWLRVELNGTAEAIDAFLQDHRTNTLAA